MKLKFLLPVILSIFLIATISALNADGDWEDWSQNLTITQGESAVFYADFFSNNPPMIISVRLYYPDGSFHSFIDTSISTQNYFDNYTITPEIYNAFGPGNYEVKILGNDASNYADTHTLTLTIQQPTDNVAPVITSTPVTSVNENTLYTYDVNATDANGNILTYSLSNAPAWLSINSANGEITGTAPEVSVNTTYSDILITVSDGSLTATQTYNLTVIDTSVPDTTAPVINIIAPEQGRTYNSSVNYINFIAIDANLNACWVNNGTTDYYATSCVSGELTTINLSSVEGLNTWTVHATDSFGNSATQNITFTVNSSLPDTTAPSIEIISPINKTYHTNDLTFEIVVDENATLEFSLDSGARIAMANPYDYRHTYTTTNLAEGNHTVTFYATDTSTNHNQASKSITFRIDADDEAETPRGFATVGLEEKDLEEEQYLNQYERQPIQLGEEEPEQELSFFQKLIKAIIDFFKRLFGLL